MGPDLNPVFGKNVGPRHKFLDANVAKKTSRKFSVTAAHAFAAIT